MYNNQIKCKEKDISASYWAAIKLAIAIACIRKKPSHLTAEQYALQLHLNYWENQLGSKKDFNCAEISHNNCSYFNNNNGNITEINKTVTRKCILSQSLFQYVNEYNSIKYYVLNSYKESITFSEYRNLEIKVLDICMKIIKSAVNSMNNPSPCLFSKYNCDLLFQASVALCEGIQFLKKNNNLSFFADVQRKSFCTVVNETIDLISLLCLNIMESSSFLIKKNCFMMLQQLSDCKALKVVLCKQMLYWICWMKDQLVLISSGDLNWNDSICVSFNNVSYILELFERLVLFLLPDSKKVEEIKNLQFSCSTEISKLPSLNNFNIDIKNDEDFFLCAKKQIEENIHLCSLQFPLFSNVALHIGFILSKLLTSM